MSMGQSQISSDELREGLLGRLGHRRAEIEQAIRVRVYSIAEATDPAYRDGLRTAIVASVDYAIAALGQSEDRPEPIPVELLAQARRAARNGVSLDVVLRRYLVGHSTLDDFIVEEAEAVGLRGKHLQTVLQVQARVLEHLVDAAAAEYQAERETMSRSRGLRRAECVRRLLAGEHADPLELNYELDAWHLGLIVVGGEIGGRLRDLAAEIDRRLLIAPCGEHVWVWLGGRTRFDPEQLRHLVWPPGIRLALGAPGRGIDGWRLTHLQAAATLPIMLRSPERFVDYADVALIASAAQDEVLRESLDQLYLSPLSRQRDEGKAVKETLRAYFRADRNVTSTASALGITRKTVAMRLQAVEVCVGQQISSCAVALETALRLEELEEMDAPMTSMATTPIVPTQVG